jgi:hypothetical protein
MEIKYQVFISSTYIDLVEERQEVMNALLELDCIPSGMELFPATNEEQWDLIKDVIDECDYYVLILGGRYGSLDNNGIGYTEKEYRYALEIGKPIISFLHKEPENLPKKKTETTENGQLKFDDFREFIQEKMCKYWTSSVELGSVVSRSLIKLQKKHPGKGWVRGDLIPSQEASLEILELRKEIERLENKLDEARTKAPKGTENLEQGDDTINIDFSFKAIPYGKMYGTGYTSNIDLSWNEIFYQVSPIMIDEADDMQFKISIEDLVQKEKSILIEISDDERFKETSIKNINIDDEFYQTIKVQLRALGLINKSSKSRSVKDTGTYWTLTPYGDSVMNKLRAIRRDS